MQVTSDEQLAEVTQWVNAAAGLTMRQHPDGQSYLIQVTKQAPGTTLELARYLKLELRVAGAVPVFVK